MISFQVVFVVISKKQEGLEEMKILLIAISFILFLTLKFMSIISKIHAGELSIEDVSKNLKLKARTKKKYLMKIMKSRLRRIAIRLKN
jgi:hypothetical protein